MSGLGLLIDCDVLIDFLTKREPFAGNAGAILKSCEDRKADYIVTRNIKDYTHSAVPAILPEDFLKLQET